MRRVILSGAAALAAVAGLAVGAVPVAVRAAGTAPPSPWTPLSPLAAGRAAPTATVLDDGAGLVLVAGGSLGGVPADRWTATEVFDPGSGTFTPGPSQVYVQDGATATRLTAGPHKGAVLLVGGRDAHGAATAAAEMYDPATRSWLDAATVQQLPQGRFAHTATLLPDGRSVLVAGGTGDGTTPLQSAALVYDSVANTWSATVTPMTTPRFAHAAAALADGRVLVAGGEVAVNLVTRQHATATAEIYDPSVGHWTPGGPLSAARSRLTLTAAGAGAVAVGGIGCTPSLGLKPTCTDSTSAATEVFDPQAKTWTSVPAPAGMPLARYAHAAAAHRGQVVVAGGLTAPGEAIVSVLSFDPGARRWTALASLGTPRSGAGLIEVPPPPAQATCQPEFLAVGGADATGAPTAAAELLDAQPWISGLTPARGPAGVNTPATVVGGALGGVTSVLVGTRAVPFDPATASVAIPPEHAPDGAQQLVRLVSPGCTSRSAVTFGYDQPQVAGVTPGFGPALAAPGQPSVTVTGTGFAGATQVLFGARPAAMLATRPDGSLLVRPPLHAAGEPLVAAVSVKAGEVTSTVMGTYRYVEPPVITGVSPASVAASDITLTISGHGFTYIQPGAYAGDGVSIGGQATGSPAVADDGDMTVALPPGLQPGRHDLVVTALGMASAAFPITVAAPVSDTGPPPTPTTDPGGGSQAPQPPAAPAGPGGGSSSAVETIPSSATLQSTGLGQGFLSNAPSLNLNPGQLPGMLQLPGYAPVGAPGAAAPGAAPATVAEGAPGGGGGFTSANSGVGEIGSDGPVRYGMSRADLGMLGVVAGAAAASTLLILLVVTPRVLAARSIAAAYARL